MGPPDRVIAGGIVAYNDERRIQESLRSLLSQELPPGVRWGRVSVIASGCTDGTVEAARAVARADPRVEIIVEPERRGKAAAIRQVLRRAEGELLVLLNSDAVAVPGAVSALLERARDKPHPFAVMARPVVPDPPDGAWNSTIRWMWDLHHELHLEMLDDGGGAHLSDELLLVSLPAVPWIEDGVINDGSYCAVWLQAHRGTCWYAPNARVLIDVPRSRGDHLRQRRRIHVGNAQVSSRLGRAPTTAFRFLFEHPRRALRAMRRALDQDHGVRHLARIVGLELAAHVLAAWDRLPPRRDHVRWSRIESAPETPTRRVSPSLTGATLATSEPHVERRVRLLLEVAREFGTSVRLDQLKELLPLPAPVSESELGKFLRQRPEIAHLEGGHAYGRRDPTVTDPERAERGLRYVRAATVLAHRDLAWLHPWVRCVGVTGSTAYGEPRAGDDLDFYVVTRSGAVPWFLCATYLTMRLRKSASAGSSDATPCFNYVVDDRRAPHEFANGRGLLFAREALSARMLLGDDYYRGLLCGAPWLGNEIPRLYATRAVDPGNTDFRPAGVLVRALSAIVFLPLAGYLQAVGLVRNARALRSGRESEVFRTVTTLDRFAFQSRRFEELRERYDQVAGTSIPYPSAGAPSRMPTLR